MNEEQIKQNAEAYAEEHAVRIDGGGWEEEYDYEEQEAAYIAGAHSRDEEIEELKEEIESLKENEKELFEGFKKRGTKLGELMKQNVKLRNPWISVKEQLPNPEDVVFFKLPKGRPYVGSYFTKDKLFMSIEGCYFVEGVTHWMMIPELKKGE